MARYLVIVRVGAVRRFEELQAAFRAEPDVQVWWDRRQLVRRRVRVPTIPDRRRGERRRPPPASWGALDFVLVWERDNP